MKWKLWSAFLLTLCLCPSFLMLFLCSSVGSHPQKTISHEFSSLYTVFWEQAATLWVLLRVSSCMGSSPWATARSWPPHGVSTVCHSIGCLTIIFTMGSRGISAPLLECLLPFLLLSPECDRVVSHVSLTPHCLSCFPRGAATRALRALRWVLGASWNSLCLTGGCPGLSSQRPPLYPPLPVPGHLHPTRCASERVPHTRQGIGEFTRNHVD